MKLIPVVILAALLLGCAGTTSKSGAGTLDKTDPLAAIRIQKNLSPGSTDCPVSVRISNRMKDTAWDGVSYQVAALDKRNIAIGQIIGAPRQKTGPGNDLAEISQVLGAKCENIAKVSLLYFAYYPSGKNAVHLHNNEVRAELQ